MAIFLAAESTASTSGGEIVAVWIGAAATVLIPLLVYVMQRQRKALAYEAIVGLPLFAHAPGGLRSDVEVRVAGQPVSEPFLFTVRVFNRGNAAITREDFERGLTLTFVGSDVLGADAAGAPEGLSPVISHVESRINLEPLLLNPGDEVLLSGLTEGAPEGVEVSARIAGVKKAINVSEQFASVWWNAVVVAGIGGGTLLLALGLDSDSDGVVAVAGPWQPAALGIGLGVLIATVTFLLRTDRAQRLRMETRRELEKRLRS